MLSNALTDAMVLRHDRAVVWGRGSPGVNVTLRVTNASHAHVHDSVVRIGEAGSWRIKLPPMPASSTPCKLHFRSSDGGSSTLEDVLFGSVFLCSGQSNSAHKSSVLDPARRARGVYSHRALCGRHARAACSQSVREPAR